MPQHAPAGSSGNRILELSDAFIATPERTCLPIRKTPKSLNSWQRGGNSPTLRCVAGEALVVLCLAWCCASCSPAAGRVPSSAGVSSARPSTAVVTSPQTTSGRQLWASLLRGACCLAGAVSPDGATVFVSGMVQGRLVKNHFETVAYRGATGARL